MGFTKWGIVIFSDLVSKARLARLGWQGRVIKAIKVIKQEELENRAKETKD